MGMMTKTGGDLASWNLKLFFYNGVTMKTTIDLEQELIDEVISLGGFHTTGEAVSTALSEYAKLLKRRRALDLYGTVEWQGNLSELRSPRGENAT